MLFDAKNSPRDDIFEPFARLKKHLGINGVTINTYDCFNNISDIDVLIVNRFGYFGKEIIKTIKYNPRVKIIYRVSEEETVEPLHKKEILFNKVFDLVLTFRDDWVDGKYFLKYYYQSPFRILQNEIAFSEKRFLTIINSYKILPKEKSGDLYKERIRAVEYFASESDIDLYGVGWEACSSYLIHSVYLGVVDSKKETLKKYKYAITFENSNNEPGGVCEKIFDVMAAGCVPVYWGAPNVLDYIPEEAFIDYRNFSNSEELDLFLKSITEDRYNEYLLAISNFLRSDMYKNFTSIGFVRDVTKAIDHVASLPEKKRNIWRVKLDLLYKIISNFNLFIRHRRFIYDVIFS